MQDWFATEHTLLDLIDAARKKWPVKTADQFHKLLCQNYAPLAKKLPSPSTLRGWFTFAGTSAASFPVPKITWTEGYTARYNVRLRISEGRPIKLLGCDEAVMQTKLWVKALRMRNIPISTPQVRGVLLAQLIATGKEDVISPHVLQKGPKQNKLFCANAQWLARFLHDCGMSYRAITGAGGKVPADHAEQFAASLERIAGKCMLWNITPARLVQGDQTFVPFIPTPQCAPSTQV